MPQQTKTELSNELSRLTNTIEDLRKQLKQKNEIVQEQKQLIDKQAQTISEQNHVIDKQKQQIELKDNDISYDTGIHSYPSATIIDLGQTVEQYSSGAKCQSLIFHAGHNSIDKGVSGVAAASQLCETVTKAIKKIETSQSCTF